MGTPISFRPNEQDEANIALVGGTATEAIRKSLAVAARLKREQQLRREAREISGNAEDRAELEELRRYIGDTIDELPE